MECMKILSAKCSGKTTELIKMSHESGNYILVADDCRAKLVREMAKKMGLNIPYPITATEYLNHGVKSAFTKREIYIDDADDVLQKIFSSFKIDTLTMRI